MDFKYHLTSSRIYQRTFRLWAAPYSTKARTVRYTTSAFPTTVTSYDEPVGRNRAHHCGVARRWFNQRQNAKNFNLYCPCARAGDWVEESKGGITVQLDALKIIGIIGTVLILGLLLKDANQFNTAVGAVNNTLSTLEKAG